MELRNGSSVDFNTYDDELSTKEFTNVKKHHCKRTLRGRRYINFGKGTYTRSVERGIMVHVYPYEGTYHVSKLHYFIPPGILALILYRMNRHVR